MVCLQFVSRHDFAPMWPGPAQSSLPDCTVQGVHIRCVLTSVPTANTVNVPLSQSPWPNKTNKYICYEGAEPDAPACSLSLFPVLCLFFFKWVNIGYGNVPVRLTWRRHSIFVSHFCKRYLAYYNNLFKWSKYVFYILKTEVPYDVSSYYLSDKQASTPLWGGLIKAY